MGVATTLSRESVSGWVNIYLGGCVSSNVGLLAGLGCVVSIVSQRDERPVCKHELLRPKELKFIDVVRQ